MANPIVTLLTISKRKIKGAMMFIIMVIINALAAIAMWLTPPVVKPPKSVDKEPCTPELIDELENLGTLKPQDTNYPWPNRRNTPVKYAQAYGIPETKGTIMLNERSRVHALWKNHQFRIRPEMTPGSKFDVVGAIRDALNSIEFGSAVRMQTGTKKKFLFVKDCPGRFSIEELTR